MSLLSSIQDGSGPASLVPTPLYGRTRRSPSTAPPRATPPPGTSLEDPVGGERFEGRRQAVRTGESCWWCQSHHPRGQSWCTRLWGRMDRGNARFRRFLLAIQIKR